MRFIEYGKENLEKIVLLHGGGLSWWNYEDVGKSLQNEYHIILPILDGHAESDKPFTTIEDNAKEIMEFIDTHCGGSVLLIGGLSLGGQILLEVLSKRNDICKYAIIESALILAIASGISFGLHYMGFTDANIIAVYILAVLVISVLTENRFCWVISSAAGCAYLGEDELHLTPIEYKILCLLAANVGKVLTHTFITQKIWGAAWENNVASLRVFMATLRKKIESTPDSPQYIQTHIGVGYRMMRVE